jgi:anti-anti-sigma regulatory factor
MSIRINIESDGPDVVLDVAGRLTGPEIVHLLPVCEQMEGQFVLDLSKLQFADDAGVEVIRTLRDGGARVRGASSFIKLLINGGTGCHN